MRADTLTAPDLFGKQVRYVIPAFQRPYVWEKDDQWEPFWEDIQFAAERYLEQLGEASHDDEEASARAVGECGRHFLGAVVLKQRLTGTRGAEEREVIDGQQRLTTLQLVLDAARVVSEELGCESEADQLYELTRNNERIAKRNPDLAYKLWPTTTDRDAYIAVMSEAPALNGNPRVAEAHEYFQLRVRDWIGDGGTVERRTSALVSALVALLELVVIDLGSSDDAFVIFETLNARGTPLLASDLVKNYLLQTASHDGVQSADEIGKQYWSRFDDNWWRTEIRQGRLHRPRLDTFLDYWLESRTAEEVASHEVFPTFKDLVDARKGPVVDIAADLTEIAGVYRKIETEINRYSRDGTFLYRWEVLDQRVLTPMLLWVFRHSPDELPPERRTRLLVHLESYLVRRAVLGMTTKQYNRTFLEVLKLLREHGPSEADQVMIDHLAKADGDSTRWPSDDDVRYAFRELPVYSMLARARVRMILEALEDDHRGAKTEDEFVRRGGATRGGLTIEHVLPQKWQGYWPLPESDDRTAKALERDRTLHTMGNLTLATSSLNSTMQNHAWEHKFDHLSENSTLLLNKKILSSTPRAGRWDEQSIADRADELFERAIRIWPRP